MMDHEYCRILIKSTPFTPMFSCFKNSLSLSAYTHWSSIFYPTPSIFAVTLARAEVPSIDSEFVVIARKFLPTGYTRNNITACLSDGFSVIRDRLSCVYSRTFSRAKSRSRAVLDHLRLTANWASDLLHRFRSLMAEHKSGLGHNRREDSSTTTLTNVWARRFGSVPRQVAVLDAARSGQIISATAETQSPLACLYGFMSRSQSVVASVRAATVKLRLAMRKLLTARRANVDQRLVTAAVSLVGHPFSPFLKVVSWCTSWRGLCRQGVRILRELVVSFSCSHYNVPAGFMEGAM